MSTDYQKAREDLGVRLRELRLWAPGGRLTGTQLADQCGWHKTKVSKLENGLQTATPEDLKLWAQATGQPEAYDELLARLQGFESHIRSWRRQLAAGHAPVQRTIASEYARSAVVHGFESATRRGTYCVLYRIDAGKHVVEIHSVRHRRDAYRY